MNIHRIRRFKQYNSICPLYVDIDVSKINTLFVIVKSFIATDQSLFDNVLICAASTTICYRLVFVRTNQLFLTNNIFLLHLFDQNLRRTPSCYIALLQRSISSYVFSKKQTIRSYYFPEIYKLFFNAFHNITNAPQMFIFFQFIF